MKLNMFLLFFILFILCCETTTKPIVYDKTINKIDKDVELITYLINNKNFKEAERRIDDNLKLYPDNIDLLQIKAWLFLSQDKLAESEEIFLNLLSINDKNPLVLAGLARIYRLKKNYEKSMEYINKAISYQPLHSILWLERGILEYEKKDYKKALTDFNKAYSVDNKNYDAYFFKYLTYIQMGREIDEVKNIWIEITDKKAALSWYYQHHADVLYKTNKKDMAKKIIIDGLNIYPDDSYLLNFYSYLLYEEYKEKKDKETIKSAKEFIIKCMSKSDEIIPEFIDTYFSIIEITDDSSVLIKEIEKYYIYFPNSEILIKWIKKLNVK